MTSCSQPQECHTFQISPWIWKWPSNSKDCCGLTLHGVINDDSQSSSLFSKHHLPWKIATSCRKIQLKKKRPSLPAATPFIFVSLWTYEYRFMEENFEIQQRSLLAGWAQCCFGSANWYVGYTLGDFRFPGAEEGPLHSWRRKKNKKTTTNCCVTSIHESIQYIHAYVLMCHHVSIMHTPLHLVHMPKGSLEKKTLLCFWWLATVSVRRTSHSDVAQGEKKRGATSSVVTSPHPLHLSVSNSGSANTATSCNHCNHGMSSHHLACAASCYDQHLHGLALSASFCIFL